MARRRGEGERNYACSNCGRRYIHQKHLNQHLKWECGKPKQFKCPYCSYDTKLKCNLKSHVVRKHELNLAA